MLGPAYLAQIEEARRLAAGGPLGGGPGIPSPPAPGTGTPTVPFDPKLSGSEYINNLAQAAAPTALPPGYTVKMTSGDRPGATVAGTGGPSQHATANAADFKIFGPDGKEIPNTGPDTTTYYGKLALTMRSMASPDIRPWLAWGGNFGTGGPGSPPDLMHFDLAGDRGHLGTLAAMERNLTAPPGGGAPSTVRGSWFGNAPGWNDKTDRGMQANGQPVSAGPGIALPIPKDSPDFGKWYDVTAPNGQTLRLQQTDVGPGPEGKGRGLDVNAVAAGQFGYNPSSFPTDGAFRVAPAPSPGARQTAALTPTTSDRISAVPMTAAAPGAPGGLLSMPDITGQMNAPIPGIAGGVAPGAAAAARPPSAGEMLVAANQRTSAAGGLPPLSPGLVQTADASGQVPIPSGPPAPNLMRGGAIPGLMQPPGAAPPPAPPPPGPAPGPPQSLVPPPAAAPPVPPIAMPQAPPPVPAAPPMGGQPGAPPPLNLPPVPPMPGGVGGMGPPIQPTPQQMIAQGIVGISALIGKPAPEYMQKLAGQPLEMQMEAYKAYLGAQANQMSEKYKKEIEVAAAGTLEYLKTQAGLPAEKEKITLEQDLKLRNDMANNGFLMGPSGKYDQINPLWLDKKAREAGIEAQAKAQYDLKEVTVTDPVTGQQRKQQMTAAQAAEYYRTQGGGGAAPGTPGAVIPGAPGAATSATPPGIPGQPIYTPAQEAGSKAVAEKNAADFATVHKEAGDAALAQAQATNMRQEAKNFYTGPGAEYNQALNKVLLTLNPSDPDRANKVASYETFIKDAGFLARDQARTLGGRIGVQELTMVRDTLAGPTTTERGLDRVMAQIQGLSDYRLVKQQAMNNYVTRPGAAPGGWDNNGFEAQFNANVSPYTLMYLRLSDQDRGELLNKLSQSKEGKAEVQRLQVQHKYLADNNLLPR
jgi:hypothetical protein